MAGRLRDAVVCLLCAVGLALGVFSSSLLAGEASEFDAVTGYRIARYRTPVPQEVPGGTRISAPDVGVLLENERAILIDVMGAEGAGPDPATGVWRLSKPRQNIPKSVWLADVGQGTLTAERDRYFRDNLHRLTAGDTARALIIYCQADCWMSWNAVRRAASYGYTKIYWFAEGTDGWRDWDGAFEAATPVPLEISAAPR